MCLENDAYNAMLAMKESEVVVAVLVVGWGGSSTSAMAEVLPVTAGLQDPVRARTAYLTLDWICNWQAPH